MTNQTDAILKERGDRYGLYENVAGTTCKLFDVAMQGASAGTLTPAMETSLFMICNKIARAVNGDPHYDDNWQDIAGYAQLVVNEIKGVKI